jgi:outer membrane receptor for ferrienterochelin and colicins
MRRLLGSLALLVGPGVAVAVPAAAAMAQTGSIAGQVTDSVTKAPLSGARVQVLNGASPVASAIAGESGSYRITNLAAGTYAVVVTRIGYSLKRVNGIRVDEGGSATANVAMNEIAAQLNQVVTTASRAPEKILDAPASIAMVESRQIQERPVVTAADQLREVPGVHATQGGVAQTNVVARGFNNAFSGSMLMLQDYRFAAVPSLKVNVPLLFTGANEDIERMEVLLGPASALYGPNSANGVLHIISKSPFDSKGTTLTIDGGERSFFRGGFRHAQAPNDKVGFKISGEYLSAKDWEFHDPVETRTGTYPATAPAGRANTPITRDFDVERMSGEARLDLRPTANTELISTYGFSRIGNGLELTGANGTAQAHNWSYQSVQQRVRWKRLFAQVFMNMSNAGNDNASDLGGTFLLWTGTPIVDKSRVMAASIQHAADIGTKQKFVYGADYIFTNPRTGNTINGRNEDIDDVKEMGAYVQSTTQLSPKFDVIAALRVDNHDVLDETYLSPRIALIFKPSPNHNIRTTYNHAFSTPANFSYFLDLAQATLRPTVPYDIRALGNPPGGLSYLRNCTGGVGGLCMRSPFPIINPANPAGAPLTPLNTPIPARAAQLYPTLIAGNQTLLAGALAAAGVAPQNIPTVIGALLAANTSNVGTVLRIFDPQIRNFNPTPVDPTTGVIDVDPLKATITDAYEVGYKGIIGNRARLAIDGWFERKRNFTTAAQNITPNAFMDPQTLGAAIGAALAAQAQAGRVPPAAVQPLATQITTQLAQVPVGTVAPNTPLADTPALFFSYRNIDKPIDVTGLDLAFDYILNDEWTVLATYSWISDVVFPDITFSSKDTLTLNSPDNRASLTTRYRNERNGLGFELRGRYANAYPVNSGVYVGRVPVNAFIDATFSYRLPFTARNVLFSINGMNLLDNEKASFVGVPAIGRMIVSRLQYQF